LISKVEFTIDDSKLFSSGSNDESIFQWRLDFIYDETTKSKKTKVEQQEIFIWDDSLMNELNFSYAAQAYAEKFIDNSVLVWASNSMFINRIIAKH